jgi:hypothetical protein
MNRARGHRNGRAGWRQGGVLTIALSALVGCAPMQPIRLDVAPERVSVFVDGEIAEPQLSSEAGVRQIALRSDVSHVLYFKRDGYQPARVVVESRSVDGEPRLAPELVIVRLDPLTSIKRALSVELDERSE